MVPRRRGPAASSDHTQATGKPRAWPGGEAARGEPGPEPSPRFPEEEMGEQAQQAMVWLV